MWLFLVRLNAIIKRYDKLRNEAPTMQIKKWLSWAAVLAWMAIIFSFSAQQGSDSGSLSGSIVGFILQFLPDGSFDYDTIHLILRKGAHLTVYLILGVLSANALHFSGVTGKKAFGYALLISVLYAISDEVHQAFVPGRGPSAFDVLIDSSGATIGIIFFQIIKRS